LKNINSFDFLENINFKKIEFNYDLIERTETIFDYKNFYNFNIKLLYYYFYLNKSFNPDYDFLLNNYYIILNKKKNHYFISIIKNNLLISSISLGTMLIYFRFTKKCLRRSQKGFTIFINTFRQFFKDNDYESLNLLINFVDQNFVIFKKYFFKNIKLNNLFLFNLNIPFNIIKYKKYKNIKRRLKKKFLKRYLI
jgi:hypothetical protein